MTSLTLQNILDGMPVERLYATLDELAFAEIESTIAAIDADFKQQLMKDAKIVHLSMESYYRMGTMARVSQEFATIERHLTCMVRDRLSLYQRLRISAISFFTDPAPHEEFETCIANLDQSQHIILTYTNLLGMKFDVFKRYLDGYRQWVTALTQFVPKLSARFGEESFQLSYRLSQTVANAAEFLATQQQLESTVSLQIQNNRNVMTDILHVATISKSLLHNTISAQHFFEREYVGSMKTIKKYKPLTGTR